MPTASKKIFKKKDRIPLATNFRKLQTYNFKFFSTEEIIIFELIIVLATSFGKQKEFYHSSAQFENETGIKRTKLDTILDRFVDLNIISITVHGMPKRKWFIVNFKQIYKLLPEIYISEDGKLSADMRKLLTGYFKPLLENSKLLSEDVKHLSEKRLLKE
ncbi:MAG TPA: hypothetical protein VK492_00370 [Chitinophagaceae bacterium]|nr:hypothetical protein [Chitinophagaceae bacterium]